MPTFKCVLVSVSQRVQVSACVWSHSGGAMSGGLRRWGGEPLGEPSLAGLISVSHLF